MKDEQIFVRGINSEGMYGNLDVMDLDDRSFRAFILDALFKKGLVTGIKPEYVEGEVIIYKNKKRAML